jgi:hypothetical protein
MGTPARYIRTLRRVTAMLFRKLLWRAAIAFVLHCTLAIADHMSACFACEHAPRLAIDTKST